MILHFSITRIFSEIKSEMPRGKPHNVYKRSRVIFMHLMKKSVGEIMAETSVSRSTIYEFIKRFQKEQKIPDVKPRDCTPYKLTLAKIR